MNFTTPILFIIFNKREETKKVFDTIRILQPVKLFIAADGPRKDIFEENQKCEYIKNWLLDNIDWDCEVYTLFRDINLGCGLAPASAISWFFEHVEEGIILEDDCVPHTDFFYYCEELLSKYRYDNKIGVIGGNNFQEGVNFVGKDSYYFSNYSFTWGWATWRRVWVDYQFNLEKLNRQMMFRRIDKTFKTKQEKIYWKGIFDDLVVLNTSAWDYQLWFHIWLNGMISIVPVLNLVTNIGFGENATHTTDKNSIQAFLKSKALLPLIHPSKIVTNYKADLSYFENVWCPKQKFNTLKWIYSLLPQIFITVYRNIKNKLISK